MILCIDVGNSQIFCGVYDGHGGDFVSNFLKRYLNKPFTSSKAELPIRPTFIKRVFDSIESKLEKTHPSKARDQGSTCLITLIYH